jgi:hypothetical protein
MLKPTIFCPPDQTDAVLAALREDQKVCNFLRPLAVEVEAGRDVVMAYVHH